MASMEIFLVCERRNTRNHKKTQQSVSFSPVHSIEILCAKKYAVIANVVKCTNIAMHFIQPFISHFKPPLISHNNRTQDGRLSLGPTHFVLDINILKLDEILHTLKNYNEKNVLSEVLSEIFNV